MPDPFSETLRNWQNFYFMVGGAGATLIGLVFVAVSLGANLISPGTRNDLDTFVTPILIYFSSVVVISCIMLIPILTPLFLGGLLLGVGGFGLARVLHVMRQMVVASQRKEISRSYWLWHAIFPLVSYALIVETAVVLALSGVSAALLGQAFSTALLLVVGIWRTWELVIWIAHQGRPNP